MVRMDAKARKALSIIRRCVASRRYRLSPHFTQRMDQRVIFWPEVLAVLDEPTDVRPGGPERYGRPKWIIAGKAASGEPMKLVCVLDRDEHGDVTVFITIY